MAEPAKTPLGFNKWKNGDDDLTLNQLTEDNELADRLIGLINSQLSSRNLIDNWDYTNPVNQRGVTGTISTAGYFIDRWRLTSGSVTLTSDGLTLNGTMIQVLERAVGTNVVASVQMQSGTADINYDDASKTVTVTSSGGTIRRVKLEVGSVSTISADPPMDYGVELTKCQRFYQLLVFPYSRIRASLVTANDIDFPIPISTQMRVTPALINAQSLVVSNISGGGGVGNFQWAVARNAPGYIILRGTKSGHGFSDSLVSTTTGTVSVDADL